MLARHVATLLALALGGCALAHGSEEGASVAEEGDVRTCERLSGCSSLETRVPVDDGCLLLDLFWCGASHAGTATPYDLAVESASRSVTQVRFTERSCDEWIPLPREARTAAPVLEASGWLRVREDEPHAGLDIAGDIGFTTEGGVERRVLIREQRVPTFLWCP